MKNILEVGCGQGFHANTLVSKNTSVTAIDISEKDVEISKTRYSGVNFLVMDSQKMEFENDSFDEVYAIDVLEHVDSLDTVLSEMARVTKKDGFLMVDVPYYKSEYWLLKIRPSYFEEIHHVRIFQELELDGLLAGKMNLLQKKKIGFLQHMELFFMFKFGGRSGTQLGIGNWRDNIFTKILHVSVLYFDPVILKTGLIILPLWVVTLPIGYLINLIGNAHFPKTIRYKFIKI